MTTATGTKTITNTAAAVFAGRAQYWRAGCFYMSGILTIVWLF